MLKGLFLVFILNGCSSPDTISNNRSQKISAIKKAKESTQLTLSAKDAFEKIKPLALKSKHPTAFYHSTEFLITLPSGSPREIKKGQWTFSSVKAFFKNKNTVDQIAIRTMNCKVTEESLNKQALEDHVISSVQKISTQLFNKPFILSKKHFKKLGQNWNKSAKASITEPYSPVRSMRLMRSRSKCDSQGGYEFRFDFFM